MGLLLGLQALGIRVKIEVFVMSFFKRKKRSILFTIFYSSVILAGVNAYYIAKNGINPEDSLFLQFSSLIAVLLVAFGSFYEIYFRKSKVK